MPESCAAATWSTRTTPVSRSTLTRTACVISCGARNDSSPRRPTQPSAGALGGASGSSPQPLPWNVPLPASSAIVTDLSGEPLTTHGASGELEIVARCLELLGRRVEQLVAHVARGLDHGAAAVERRLRAGRAHVPRARVGVLVEDREVLGLHPELLGDVGRHRHHRAGAVLLRAGDDRAGAVAVQLHVGAARLRRSTATSRTATPIASSSGSSRP